MRPELTAELIDELVGGCIGCKTDLELCLYVLSEITELSRENLSRYRIRLSTGVPNLTAELRCTGRLEFTFGNGVVDLGAFIC
jgi:hypothetical protein